MGLEGIVSKHRERGYRAGRTTHWIKVKNPNSPAMVRARDAFRAQQCCLAHLTNAVRSLPGQAQQRSRLLQTRSERKSSWINHFSQRKSRRALRRRLLLAIAGSISGAIAIYQQGCIGLVDERLTACGIPFGGSSHGSIQIWSNI
jgi:hypothetical protein